MDVSACLYGLGLGQYDDAFRENDIDAEVLADLTAEDLIALGVTSVGHRRRLLGAISTLQHPTSLPTTPPLDPQPAALGAASLAAEGERRQVTVMFADLVGSTVLSAQLIAQAELGLKCFRPQRLSASNPAPAKTGRHSYVRTRMRPGPLEARFPRS
jgi:hypothetical protein